MIAAVEARALVDIETPGLIEFVAAKAVPARAHRDTVHRVADLLAAAVAVPTGVGGSAGGSVPGHVARRALATKRSHGVDARVRATAIAVHALVHVRAAPPIRRQPITRRALATIIALDVHATVGASAVLVRALVDVHAAPRVVPEAISSRTSALEGALEVHAYVRAAAVLDRALVDVPAHPAIRVEPQTYGAAAPRASADVEASVRASAVVHLITEKRFVLIFSRTFHTKRRPKRLERIKSLSTEFCEFGWNVQLKINIYISFLFFNQTAFTYRFIVVA